MCRIIKIHCTLMWWIEACGECRIKQFQMKLPWVWNQFIPHESQVSIYHNQGVVSSLSCLPIRSYLNLKPLQCCRFSLHLHPNKDVSWTCLCCYGNVTMFIFGTNNVHIIDQDSNLINTQILYQTQLSTWDILVSWILCPLYLYTN